ncbi:hypothetical protein EOD39_6633 [Acipenser ruthenus]|uniref:Uncharacterized protein n=1 Tax=Acipenser ruthenus TaxID=7906 RepID=A0A444U9K1_ACIRT|nr:hypothetical protein EOD39_6633 [Acipenser ruthenus]
MYRTDPVLVPEPVPNRPGTIPVPKICYFILTSRLPSVLCEYCLSGFASSVHRWASLYRATHGNCGLIDPYLTGTKVIDLLRYCTDPVLQEQKRFQNDPYCPGSSPVLYRTDPVLQALNLPYYPDRTVPVLTR